MIPIALALVIFCAVNCGGNETIPYYANLIGTEITRAYTYPLPEDSSAFEPSSTICSDYGSFDYIIVGAGSAGSVIANRLSENETNKILLLEAGGNETDFSDIPIMLWYLQGLEFNWNYITTRQTKSCLGMVDKKCSVARGMGLGGSSIINAMVYARGNKRDYDRWSEQGNDGWAYEDVLPFFKLSENSHINGDPGYHGTEGNLHVNYPQSYSPQVDAFLNANVDLGRQVVDYNGEEQLGVARTQFNIINGRRDSTGKAFLRPALTRPNLKVLTHSLVTKILMRGKKAIGAKFSRNHKCFIAKARKEVIVSAGAINSPQLLMLSGIGPPFHLLSLGIPVVHPLSAGKNLQDQPSYFALHFTTNYTEPPEGLEQMIQEYLNGDGPFTVAGNAQGLGFFQTKLENTTGYPDIELVIAVSNNTIEYIQKVARYTNESYNAIWANIDPTKSFTIVVVVLHPKSKGEIRLNSCSPYEYPSIDPNYLSDIHGEDIERMFLGIKLALEIALNTTAFRKLNATLLNSTHPACQNHEYLSRKYWYCQLKQLTLGFLHPIGTCKMGPDPIEGAVVNDRLKVHGIKNLRVADASIMPDLVSGHTNAASIMIGEKCAHFIKNGE